MRLSDPNLTGFWLLLFWCVLDLIAYVYDIDEELDE
jgi:hypothetical protein